MSIAFRRAFVAVAVLVAVGVQAEEKHGVQVYPGAGYDAATSSVLKDSMKLDAGCYRTDDDVAKVVAFYRKQPGFELVGNATAEGGMLKKGHVDVTVQRPWMDMKTGKMNKDTLISIVKHK